MPSTASGDAIVQALSPLLADPDAVIAGERAGHYAHDMSVALGLQGRPDAVALPGDRDEACALVAWCYEHGVPIVPRGGGTGVAGGATPVSGGVVLSLERMRAVRSFDPLLWRIHVEAGVTTRDVQRLAYENGLYFGIDPGASEQSQIGGNIATNAGGPHSFKYGTTRAWVTGLEAVLAPGRLVTFGGPVRKDVAGYDLVGLLTGSEGTLGVITAAWLKLVPAPAGSFPACAFFPDARAGAEAIERLIASGTVPAAIEYLDAPAMRLAGATFPGPVPGDGGFLVIAEADGSEEERAELLEALGDGAFPVPARELWAWRDGVSQAIATNHGGKLSDDIAVPLDRFAEAVEATVEIGRRHGLDACSFGHAGDGNLHSSFLLTPGDPDELSSARAAAEELVALAIGLGGTMSGEHGVGVLKNGRLSSQWVPEAVGAHRAIKEALDPKGLLNPGKKLA